MTTRLVRSGCNRAFTLLEIVVVTGVVTILLALALPAFEAARMQSWAIASVSNLRQLTEANMAYAVDNGRYCPADNYWNNRRWCGGRRGSSGGANDPWDPTQGYLSDYFGKSRRVTPCPLFTQMLQRKAVSSFEDGSGGYGYNSYIGGSVPGNFDTGIEMIRVSFPVGRMAHPAETIMFGTSALAYSDRVQSYPYLEPPYWADDTGVQPLWGRPTPSLHFRFNGKAIVSWCDGHISFEVMDKRSVGWNPYGGDASKQNLGWFGPDDNNGYWNPDKI